MRKIHYCTSFILMIVFMTLTFTIQAQTLKRTYYDFQKTRKSEEYYVNEKGEKNGKYTKYSRDGIIEEEGNFKNGLFNGIYIKYTTVGGQQQVHSKITYKDGVAEGEATLYYDSYGIRNSYGVASQQGNYKNDVAEGVWTIIETYSNDELLDADKKGNEYVKGTVTYKNGQQAYEGVVTMYFYPSGKLCGTATYKNGNKVGDNISYFPDGKIYMFDKYDSTGQMLDSKIYNRDGSLKWENNIAAAKKEVGDQKEAKKNEEKRKYNQSMREADSLFNKKQFEKAKDLYNGINYNYVNQEYLKQGFKLTQAEKDSINNCIKKINDLLDSQKKQEADLQNEATKLPQQINDKWNQVAKKYGDGTMGAYGFQVTQVRNKRIIYEKVLDGLYHHLFNEYQNIYQEYTNLYNNGSAKLKDYQTAQQYLQNQVEKGNFLLKLLGIADKLADTPDTKDIEKQLKQAQTDEDIKKIIGLE